MQTEKPGDALLPRLQAQADANGWLSFERYMETVLYDPEQGYYRRERRRVGRAAGTDFYTASSLQGGVWARLIIEAACRLLPPELPPGEITFVEIGAEPHAAILDGHPHPFRATTTLRVGSTLEIPAQAVVFSNELFDAQPFRRLRFLAGRWHELGVRVGPDNSLTEAPGPAALAIEELPDKAPEGYTLDYPAAAHRLLEQIAAPPWAGAFIAADYGLPVELLLHERPQGTARAYFQHRQDNDLLATPGERDLTCHVGWDWLTRRLTNQGFAEVGVERQEAFLMRRAPQTIGAILSHEPGRFSSERQTLKELLHPGNLGTRFQILHGRRELRR